MTLLQTVPALACVAAACALMVACQDGPTNPGNAFISRGHVLLPEGTQAASIEFRSEGTLDSAKVGFSATPSYPSVMIDGALHVLVLDPEKALPTKLPVAVFKTDKEEVVMTLVTVSDGVGTVIAPGTTTALP